MSQRKRWRAETLRSVSKENQVVLPLVSALLGVLLAFLTERLGPAADPDSPGSRSIRPGHRGSPSSGCCSAGSPSCLP